MKIQICGWADGMSIDAITNVIASKVRKPLDFTVSCGQLFAPVPANEMPVVFIEGLNDGDISRLKEAGIFAEKIRE
jgi:hypothetical protein